jgi:hypothetical protein
MLYLISFFVREGAKSDERNGEHLLENVCIAVMTHDGC